MGRGTDLEEFRSLFRDNRLHIAVGKILRLSMASDRSSLSVFVEVWPEQREIVARMSWEAVGPSAGFFFFPVAGDLVLIGFAEGDDDHAFVLKRLTSKEDKIPLNCETGAIVLKALDGKNAFVTAEKTFITKNHTEATENFVLGQQLKAFLGDLLLKIKDLSDKVNELSTEISTHNHIGNLGYPTSAPNQAAAFVQFSQDFTTLGEEFNTLKESPVDSEDLLSDIAFTEKG